MVQAGRVPGQGVTWRGQQAASVAPEPKLAALALCVRRRVDVYEFHLKMMQISFV